jgi:hypothetical protein
MHMLTKTLFTVVVIVALFLIACARERRRERSLREWVARRPGSWLFWPFTSAEHPELPIGELIERLTGHLPLGLASAMLVRQGDGDVWWVEYRATPSTNSSSKWFTLMVRQCTDHAAAELYERELQRTAPTGTTLTHDSWVCQRHHGLITVKLLEAQLLGHASTATPRVEGDHAEGMRLSF